MALELFYSALHWSKKAERFATSAINSARTAQTAAAQASQASGKIVQLGFDGTLEDGVLTFKHAPSGIEIPYDLLDDYEYEIDMVYQGSDLADNVELVVKNGADTINFVSALHRDSTTPVTVNEMKQVMRFNDATGYRWLFKAAFKITPAEQKVFLLYPVISLASSGLEIGDIGIAPFGIDESLNLRRYLNGQVISQEQFQSFTNKIKKAVELYPNLSTTEENWQAEVTASVLGQCGKFVIDDTAGTIRLPKAVNINSLQDLALIGGIKTESLPNISGVIPNVWKVNEDPTGAFFIEGNGISNAPSLGSSNSKNVKLDASLSSSTYQDNAPVQQEAIQYPYFIQVATGVEETLPAISEYKLNNPNFFGQSMWTDVTPNNSSWLLSNGAFHSGATYDDYYEWLLKIYNGTETVDGVSVKSSTDTYDDYDFVINTADQTFRLPLDTRLASGKAVKGNGMTLGFTNGINNFGASIEGEVIAPYTGTYGTAVGSARTGSQPHDTVSMGITTDPTKSGIETASDGLKLYFYVGDTLKDAQVINAGATLTRVAELSDSYISGLGMPSGRYINLTLLASGSTYTAPANGYFYAAGTASSSNNLIQLRRLDKFGVSVTRTTTDAIRAFVPALKGDVYVLDYRNIEGLILIFVYAEGEN